MTKKPKVIKEPTIPSPTEPEGEETIRQLLQRTVDEANARGIDYGRGSTYVTLELPGFNNVLLRIPLCFFKTPHQQIAII